MKIADAIWVATALLHKEKGPTHSFKIREIVQRAIEEKLAGGFRGGLQPHASLHCVANKPPNPGRYRMLYRTGPQRRRLFRASDDFHPSRKGGKITPDKADLPPAYQDLLSWYEKVYTPHAAGQEADETDHDELRPRGMTPERESRKLLIEIPGALLARAQRLAVERGTDRSKLIRAALEDFVAKAEQTKLEQAMAESYAANAEMDKQMCDEFGVVDRETLG